MTPQEKARDFINNEQQFHLGFLPTEQSHIDSRTLEDDFKHSSVAGVATLQKIDRNVLTMAQRLFASDLYRTFADTLFDTLKNGGRIVFSGCGATGRLSILLESMWRTACRDHALNEYADRVFSIMTGGDFALVKSVEFFEDYACFGKRQVQERAMTKGDVLVAITEGGETSSVLGTVEEAADRGAKVFLLFNNPADLLAERLERSRRAIQDPRVTVLDLFCGPMALAGSTRMQATTSEQLIAGAALESAFFRLKGETALPDYAQEFSDLLDILESGSIRSSIASYIDFEASVYEKHGKITYFTHDFLLDIFTDTTERSPTFMLPPFRGASDHLSPQSWAFVKDVFHNTEDAWKWAMVRPLRCLKWTMPDYIEMGVSDRIRSVPAILEKDLLDFKIGAEDAPERRQHNDAAVIIAVGKEGKDTDFLRRCAEHCRDFETVRTIGIGSDEGDFSMSALCAVRQDMPLRLMEHMAVKLVLNTISTGVMTKNGRVSGNWMSYVALSNKKLIDRGIRLLAELGSLSYENAALKIFEAMEECTVQPGEERPSAVQYALKKLKGQI